MSDSQGIPLVSITKGLGSRPAAASCMGIIFSKFVQGSFDHIVALLTRFHHYYRTTPDQDTLKQLPHAVEAPFNCI
jgi:hypothetical protein